MQWQERAAHKEVNVANCDLCSVLVRPQRIVFGRKDMDLDWRDGRGRSRIEKKEKKERKAIETEIW